MNKLYVIGIGYKPLDKKAKEIILNSDVILASRRLFEPFQGYDEFESVKEKVRVLNVNETFSFIENNYKAKKVVLLASGDPLFSGIGRRALSELGKDEVEIIPELSSIQVAFSRIKEPWDDAFLISLHGGPDPAKRRRLPYEIHDIPFLLERHSKIGILTDRENNPAEIAKVVNSKLRTLNSELIMYVCEKLGYPEERTISGTPEEIAGMSFSEPNVVIIKKSGVKSPESEDKEQKTDSRFGLTENEISHSWGLITKDEARAVAIHKLRLPQHGVLWDIGAGSGSVSIEAARLCSGLMVFSIEKDKEQTDNIKRNKIKFDVHNIEIIEGEAPDALKKLPSPDRVFIGGSGGELEGIISAVKEKMPSGIIVINAAKIETLHDAVAGLEKAGFAVDSAQISVSRTKAIGDGNYLSALNPVFIIRGERSQTC